MLILATAPASQVSTYKIVTVNASRQTSDHPSGIGSSSRQVTSGHRLTSHPENSAIIEQEILDEELHSPNDNAKDEMQTWMLLEVSCKHVVVSADFCHVDHFSLLLMLLDTAGHLH